MPIIETAPFIEAKKRSAENIRKEKEEQQVENVTPIPIKETPSTIKVGKDVNTPTIAPLVHATPHTTPVIEEPSVQQPSVEKTQTPLVTAHPTLEQKSPSVPQSQEAKGTASFPTPPKDGGRVQPAIQEEKESFLSRFLPWILLLILLSLVTWGVTALVKNLDNETRESTEQMNAKDSEEASGQSDGSDDGESGQSDSETQQPAKVEVDKQGKVIPIAEDRPDQCIIIAGSYLYQDNIEAMVAKIERLGYQVYKEKYGQHIRVGFTFPCGETNLKVFIEEIRAKLSSKAWYLVPDLAI